MSYLVPPSLDELPLPPAGRTGWPWTEASDPFPHKRKDGSDWPSLCVVTPSFRQADYIEETIRSVLLQGYPQLEYFIIDGGSNDGSAAIIEKYSQWLSGWVSEPDNGQVDAILKGLSRGGSEYFTWLNSDDLFEASALYRIATLLEGQAVGGVVTEFSSQDEDVVRPNLNLDFHSYITPGVHTIFHQPGIIWPMNKKLIAKLDPELHYGFDRKLLLNYLFHFGPVTCVPEHVARFRLHSSSKTISLIERFFPEFFSVIEEFVHENLEQLTDQELKCLRRQMWTIRLVMLMRKPESRLIREIIKDSCRHRSYLRRETFGALWRAIAKQMKEKLRIG